MRRSYVLVLPYAADQAQVVHTEGDQQVCDHVSRRCAVPAAAPPPRRRLPRQSSDLLCLRRLIENAPRSTWSDGIPPPPLHPHILKGTRKGSKIKAGGKVRYTAMQMMKFALARCAPIHRRPHHRPCRRPHLRPHHPHCSPPPPHPRHGRPHHLPHSPPALAAAPHASPLP